MEKLYRIISFPTFINMIESNQERYVNPISWEDTYEGYMLRLMENEKDRKKVIEYLYNTVSPNDIEKVISNYMKLWDARWLCYGQCWSKTEESDAMWRIYSYGKKSVRIETTDDEIKKLIKNSNFDTIYSVQIEDVKYDLFDENELKLQMEFLKKSKKTIEPFLHKRKFFEHENEKRVIVFDKQKSRGTGFAAYSAAHNLYADNSEIPLELNTETLLPKIEDNIVMMQRSYEKEKPSKEIFVDIPDINQYIKSVMVHPQADQWIVELVKRVCARVGLNYVGQSHMYDKLV